MEEVVIKNQCPFCGENNLETVVKAPFIRGYLISNKMGFKTFIGCCSCVRSKMYMEVLQSALVGWFSYVALVTTPFTILYNLVRRLFIRKNYEAVSKHLQRTGIPENSEGVVDVLKIGYSLAVAMIIADQKILDEEIEIAERVGKEVFPDFNSDDFRAVLKDHRYLPSVDDLAALLGNVLDEGSKLKVYQYIQKIAESDGEVAAEEDAVLQKIAFKFDLFQNIEQDEVPPPTEKPQVLFLMLVRQVFAFVIDMVLLVLVSAMLSLFFTYENAFYVILLPIFLTYHPILESSLRGTVGMLLMRIYITGNDDKETLIQIRTAVRRHLTRMTLVFGIVGFIIYWYSRFANTDEGHDYQIVLRDPLYPRLISLR